MKPADEELENEKCQNESATQQDLVEQKLKHEEVKSCSHGPSKLNNNKILINFYIS